MAQLNVYDKFGDQLESHVIEVDLLSWIEANCPDYKETIRPPYYATLNGKLWRHDRHGETLNQNDVIDLTIEPKDPGTIALVVIAVLSAGYAYYVSSNLPDYQNSSEPGKSIYAPSANANSIVPSGLIREVAGQMTIYPDLICPPHRRYENNDEYLYLMLSVGAGYFSISQDNIYIAETPIINYIGDISADIYEPGATVSSSEASENWYQSNEVSDLKLTTASTPQFGQWSVDYLDDTMTSSLDGNVTAFPYEVDEIFFISTGTNIGYYRVVSLGGSSDETATVVEVFRASDDTALLEAISQREYDQGRIRRFVFGLDQSPTNSALTENVDWEGVNGGINWEGPFQITPEGETCRYAEVDILFVQGLTDVNDDGDNIDTTVEIEVQWRERGSATWTTVSGTSYTAKTYNQLGYTIEVDFGSSIIPEMRFRRVTRDSEDINISDMVVVRRVKSLLETPTSYSDITTIAMRLKGTNALARTAENKINVRGATRKLPTLSELEAGSFDLSSSATLSANGYDIDGAEFFKTTITIDENTPILLGGKQVVFAVGGTKLLSFSATKVKVYTLAVPYRPDQGMVYNGFMEPTVSGFTIRSVSVGPNGTSLYLLTEHPMPGGTYRVDKYVMTFPDEGEVSYVYSSQYVDFSPSQIDDPYSIYVESTTRFYLSSRTEQTIYSYAMTGDDPSTAVEDTPVLDVSAVLGDNSADSSLNLQAFTISDSGSKIYAGSRDGSVYQFSMSTANNIGTAVYDNKSATVFSQDDIYELTVTQTGLYSSNYNGYLVHYLLPEFTETRATRSIARFVGWTLYDALGDDAATMVDWDALDTLNTLWESRGDYLDAEFVDETTLWEAIKVMLAPGYAEPTIKEGQFLPVRIAAGSDYSHLYTPDIMTGDGLQISHAHYDAQEPDGIDVEYFSLETNQMEVVECRATGDLGIRPKRIQAIGITDRTKAWRYGMRERNRLRYKPGNLEFSTEMDALNSEYGDAIAVASDIFTSQCGEVVSYSAPEVTLDFEPEFGSGAHYMAFRNRDGEMSGLYTVIATSNPDTVELTSPTTLDFDPVTDGSMDSTFCTFGNANEWGIRAICRRISPQGENNVNVTAEEYVAAVYQDDDNSPPS